MGVAPDATPDQIRAAYRRLARRHHPDLTGTTAASDMSALNAAYRVLSDPARRFDYDRALRTEHRPAPVPPAEPDDDAVPVVGAGAARFPWRGLALATTIAVVGVATASVLSGPPDTLAPDGILQPGSCVRIEPNTDAREVACTGADDLVVRELVPVGSGCPLGTEPHRDHQGQGVACIDRSLGEPSD